MTDEFRQPLQPRSRMERLRARLPSPLVMVAVSGCLLFAGLTYLAVTAEDPVGTKPVVTVAIDDSDPIVTSSTKPETEKPGEWVLEDENKYANAKIIIETSDVGRKPEQKKREAVKVALAPAPQRDLVERTKVGNLPRISKKGRIPALAYARPVSPGVLQSSKPKIALILGGMGLNSNLTRFAIKDLPGEVTFAFAPYGKGLQRSINEARADGHEVLLHLPMEPRGYPSVNPGPKTLLVKADDKELRQNLHWLMSRFSGYVGVTNYLGSQFVTNSRALLPVFEEFKKRGLVYVDDGKIEKSQAPRLGRLLEFPVGRTDMVIDRQKHSSAVQVSLSKLEELARKNGIAIGTGTGLNETIRAVAQWSEGLEEKGILLVPVSAVFAGNES